MKKGEFVATERVRNMPYWSVWTAVKFLGCSDATQGKLLDNATPEDARAAAVARVLAHLLHNSAQQCIKESDYALVLQILNTMKEIMDTMLVGARFPEMSPDSIRNGDFAALHRYTEEVFMFLQGPPPPPPPPEW
jgi:hypothetical protein